MSLTLLLRNSGSVTVITSSDGAAISVAETSSIQAATSTIHVSHHFDTVSDLHGWGPGSDANTNVAQSAAGGGSDGIGRALGWFPSDNLISTELFGPSINLASIGLSPGDTPTITFDARAVNGAGESVIVYNYFYNSSGGFITGGASDRTINPTTTWSNFEAQTVTIPTGAASIQTTLYIIAPSGNFVYIDNYTIATPPPLPQRWSTPTFKELGSGTNLQSVAPPGIQVGDVVFAVFAENSGSGEFFQHDTTWTAVPSGTIRSGTTVRMTAYYKVATDANIGNFTMARADWTSEAGPSSVATWWVRGFETTNVFDATTTTAQANATTLSVTSPTTATGEAVLFGIAAANSSANSNPLTKPTEMALQGTTSGTGRRMTVAAERRPTPGAPGTRTWSVTSAVNIGGMTMALKPGPPPVTATPITASDTASIAVTEATQIEKSAAPVAFRSAASNSGETASVIVTKPAGTIQGDLMIASFTGDATADPTAPAGWTLGDIGNPGAALGSNAVTAWWWKVAGASEPADYTFTQTSSADSAAGIITLTGAEPTSPIDTWSENIDTVGSSTITVNGVTTQYTNEMLVIIGGQQVGGTAGDWTPPASITQRYDVSTVGSGVSNFGGTEALLTPSSTGTRTLTSNRGNPYVVYMIAVRPTVIITPTPVPGSDSVGLTVTEAAQVQKTAAPVAFRSASSVEASTASVTVSKPAGTTEGDLMIASFTGNATADPTAPAGWTLGDVGNPGGATGFNAVTAWWWKIAGASEPASYVFTQTGSTDSAAGIIALIGADSTNPIDTWSENINTTGSSTVSVTGVSTSATNEMLIIVGGQRGGS